MSAFLMNTTCVIYESKLEVYASQIICKHVKWKK